MRVYLAAVTAMVSVAVFSTERDPSLEEVVVVASKIERPLYRVASQVTQLYREDLQFQQMQAFSEIARYQATLDDEYEGSRFGSTGISIRGIGGNRVAMEMDGVPLPQHLAVGAFANSSRTLVDPAIIDRVEALRGPAASLYGSDAIGGVIAITSVEPQVLLEAGKGSRVNGGASLRTMDDSNSSYFTYAFGEERHSVGLSVSRRNSHEMANKADTTADDLVDSTDQSVFGKWVYHPTDAVTVRAIADIYDRSTRSDLRSVLGYGRQYGSTIALYGDDSQERHRFSLDATFNSAGLFDQASVMMFFQNSETLQDTSDYRSTVMTVEQLIERRFELTQRQSGVEGKLRWDFSTGVFDQVLVTGLEWEKDEITESRDGLDTNLASGLTSKLLPPGELLPQRDLPKSKVESIGLYIQDEIHYGDWTFIPALRWDRFKLDASADILLPDVTRMTNLVDDNLSSQFGMTYRFSEELTGFAHYAEGFRAPPPEDVNLYLDYRGFVDVRALPNPDLKPESSKNYELGVRFKGSNTSLEISVYRSRYRNFIESRMRIGVDAGDGALLFQSRNIANVRTEGVEAELSQSLSVVHRQLSDWTLAVSMHISRGENTDTGEPINLVNPAKIIAGVEWKGNDALSASLLATHYAKKTNVDRSGGDFFIAPAATVFDLLGRWHVSPRMALHVGVYNLADKRYWKYSNVRTLEAADPRVDILSQPGRSLAVSIHVGY